MARVDTRPTRVATSRRSGCGAGTSSWHVDPVPVFRGFEHFNQDRLARYDLGPPDWRADHWTSPELVESVQLVVDWVRKYRIQPLSSLTYSLEDADNRFVSGSSATYQFGTHRYASWREKMQFSPDDAVWARFPRWDGKRCIRVGSATQSSQPAKIPAAVGGSRTRCRAPRPTSNLASRPPVRPLQAR